MTSVEILVRKLEETHGEIVRVRCEVVETLRAFYAGASAISADDAIKIASRWTANVKLDQKDTQSDLQEKMQRLNQSLLDTVAQLQLGGSAAETKLVTSFTQRERLKKQMEQSKQMITLIEKLTAIDQLLGGIDTHLGQHCVVQAAESLAAVETLLEQLQQQNSRESEKTAEGDHSNIIRMMQIQILKKRNQLVCQLKQFHACSILWKEGILKVTRPKHESGVLIASSLSSEDQLREFWRACEAMNLLVPTLKDVAKSLSQQLLRPLLQTPNSSLKVTRDSSGSTIKVIRGDDDPLQKKSEVSQVEDTCTNVGNVLGFVHAEIFLDNTELMKQLAELLWKIPGTLESQLINFLQDKIPQEAAALNSYRDALRNSVSELERNLLAIGFAAIKSNQLRRLVNEMNELYSKKRRQYILSKSRKIMSGGYHDSMKVTGATERCNINASVGSGNKSGGGKGGKGSNATSTAPSGICGDDVESGCFEMPNYRVTMCAHDIVELAHQTLIEACTSDPECSYLLFQTSRDLLFLFRAVVPTLYKDNITNDARTCMLYHNDCMYIAHHMITIGHHYKHRLPPPLNKTATMIDMVPVFRDAGEQTLILHARSLTDDIATGMQALPGLGDVDSDHTMQHVEQYIKTSLYKLNRLSSSWREGLPIAVYNKIMALMVDPLVKGFVDRVLAETNFSANAGIQLHHLLVLLLECESLFDSTLQAEKYVESIPKLRTLCDLLMDPLSTIRDKYHSGSLSAFLPQELVGFVRALFRDSNERNEFLNALL